MILEIIVFHLLIGVVKREGTSLQVTKCSTLEFKTRCASIKQVGMK